MALLNSVRAATLDDIVQWDFADLDALPPALALAARITLVPQTGMLARIAHRLPLVRGGSIVAPAG